MSSPDLPMPRGPAGPGAASRGRRHAALLAGVGLLLAVVGLLPAPAARAETIAPAPTAPEAAAPEADSDAGTRDPDRGDADDADDAGDADGGPEVPGVPDVIVSVDSEDEGLSRTVVLLLLLTVGSVAPALLLLTTTFTRFVIVLGLAKNAIGAQTIPPPQVIVGLSLFLTFFVMGPTFSEVNAEAIQPMLAGELDQGAALEAGVAPLRDFMFAQTREEDLGLFLSLSDAPEPATPDDVPTTTLIPAFVISELRTAFVIGFVVFVPFLVIDLVVASVLMSLGMMMLPPVFVSLPIKILLFILVDGWSLIVGSLVNSVQPVV